MTATNNFALRLQASVMEELRKVVAEEGTTLNQFINVAVAEKLATLRTVEHFKARRASEPASVLGDPGTGGKRATARRRRAARNVAAV